MAESMIVCPNCKQNIPLNDAIERPMRERMEKEVALRIEDECNKFKAQTQQTLQAQYQQKEKQAAQQMEALRLENAAAQRRAETLTAKEQSLVAEKAKLEELRQSVDAQVAEKLNAQRQKLTAEALQRATEQKALEMHDLQQRLAEKDTKLQQAQQLEITLRNERVKLEEQKRELELQTIRQLDEERGKIREAATKAADETHRLKEREAEEKMAAMRRQIDELRQKADQGSQQMQGEVLELELEDLLRAAFPHDVIEPVPKGVHGGDVVQKVMTPALQYCGTILWESKRTRTWSDGFIDKLKDDQRKAKADVAMIVSVTLPKTVVHFGNMDGVWVTSRECMMATVSALRTGLLQLAGARRAAEGQHEKMQVLYRYVSSHEFKQRVEGVVEAFLTMKEELDKERTAITKMWAKREKQIERVMESTTGLVGDIAGIVGGAMPALPQMELPALAESGENEPARLG